MVVQMEKRVIGFLILVSTLCSFVSAKECTNSIPQSHTIRAQLMVSTNETWKEEFFSHYHLTPTDESAWMDLRPRKLLNKKAPLEEFDWAMLYRSMKGEFNVLNSRMHGEGNFLKEISLHDVRVDPDSRYGKGQQTNLEYLLLLDSDNLVWSFRKQHGLPTPGTPYGGWEAPTGELRGHFVGHYLSATALMWASTHNNTIYDRMTAVVDALSGCQNKTGTGYLSAFPTEFFDRFEAVEPVWAPYYTIHKIMAGLLAQYSFANNSKALQIVIGMAEYFGGRVKNVIQKWSIEQHWKSLNEETGGMNDVLYKLYSITGNQKHLILAHLFDKPCFLGMLALQADSIAGFHANTHIPIVIGAQARYEVTGDPLYREIGTFFMDIVNASHVYATGGTSISEFWSNPKRLADTLSTEDEESCTTYNMLKVSRNLFRWTKEMAYADYYERALINGVLSIQRGRDPGIMIYMLPQGPGQSKARSYHGWGTQFNDFWCCYGTGVESFSKLGDSIYFEEMGSTPGLYIIQFIPSSISWKSGGVAIRQKMEPINSLKHYVQVILTIQSSESTTQSSILHLRIPFWTTLAGAKAQLNAQDLPLPSPGSFLSITRNWSREETLSLQLPISLRTEAINDDRPDFASLKAILFGPIVLAGLTSMDWEINASGSTSMADWISPVPESSRSQLISFYQQSGERTLFLSNFNFSIVMGPHPKEGTKEAVQATFRLIPQALQKGLRAASPSPSSHEKSTIVGQLVKLEPFDLPGMYVVHRGANKVIGISASAKSNYVFRVVNGLDGDEKSVSLESMDMLGCFVYSDLTNVELSCGADKPGYEQGASFKIMSGGLRQYHPISFVAKGVNRDFLLEPLYDMMDESYTVYFNINTSG